ncbi:unnamed protein product, partial [marine sediment metagenome]
MRLSTTVKLLSRSAAVIGYLTKEDILLILSILIMSLQLLYDYLKDR